MQTCKATRRIEFDMGHRVPNHKSKCRNVHGHRYVLLVTAEAPLISDAGDSSEGMVIDFGDMKRLIGGWIDDALDHGYMGHQTLDREMLDYLAKSNMKHTEVSFIPTAENIAAFLFVEANKLLSAEKKEGQEYLRVSQIVLYETPNGSVEVNAGDLPPDFDYFAKSYVPTV